MAKIHKVAELAGVSTATVSRALAGKPSVTEETRRRVEAAARELGYVVSATASSLSSGKTRNVGIVMPFLTGWYFSEVLAGAHRTLVDAGYDVTLYQLEPAHINDDATSARREMLLGEFLQRKRVDGLLAVALEVTPGESERIASLGKPLVTVGGRLDGFSSVSVDHHRAAQMATEHLLSQGHRHVAYVGGSDEHDLDFRVPSRRREGYEQAMREAGLPVDGALIAAGPMNVEGGRQAIATILDRASPRPSGVVAASDEMAIGVMLGVSDASLSVPNDVSVMGIDGHPLGDTFRLTTVAQRPRHQGERGAQILLDLMGLGSHSLHIEEVDLSVIARRSVVPR